MVAFPRVAAKLAMMAAEIMIARQITYFAAREKDADRRCDLEAGMAKLLGARVAWAAADNGLQIHGGNGFALEYPISRVLCDARILNIFEGAAEIQAQVIARQITYFAAREKDADRRCDLEAGMAKLLGARIAWAAADNGLQIHGGNGFALEYPISRVLCDARILNIFEGAAEIQAGVIARRVLAGN